MKREPVIILEALKIAAALIVVIFVDLPAEVKTAIIVAIIGVGTAAQRGLVTPVADPNLPPSRKR